MNTIDEIKTAIGTVSFQEKGIIRYEIDNTDEITVENIKEFLEAVKKLGGGKPFCNIIVMKKFVQVDDEARKYSASEESNIYTIADAFVINSIALKLVGNFYIRYNKPVKPTRLFNNEEDALTWLRTFL